LGAAFSSLLALRYLLSRWVNALGVIGVAAAVWALIVVPAIFSGFIADIHREVRRSSPDLLLTNLPNDTGYETLRAALAGADGVVAIAPRLRHYGVCYPRTGGGDRTFSVEAEFSDLGTNFVQMIGIDPQAEAAVTPLRDWQERARDRGLLDPGPALDELGPGLQVPPALEREGRIRHGLPVPAEGSTRSIWPGLMLSSDRANRLPSLRPGYPLDVVAVAPMPQGARGNGMATLKKTFAYAGCYSTGARLFDSVTALVAIEPLRELLGQSSYDVNAIDIVTDVAIRATDGLSDAQLEQLAAKLLERVRPALPAGAQPLLLTWRGQNQVILDAVDLERSMTTVVLFAVMLIAAFLIYATLHMMVTQKRKDIGILTALGGAPRAVGAVFTRCGLVIGLFGSGGGVLAGIGSLHALNPVNDWMTENFGIAIFDHRLFDLPSIPWVLDPLWVAEVAVAALATALFVAWLPARKAARMQPVKTLAYE